MTNLKQIYASMSDDDLEAEIQNHLIINLEYCIELWSEQDRRAEYQLMMYEANQQ
jgi:hypothetical protein